MARAKPESAGPAGGSPSDVLLEEAVFLLGRSARVLRERLDLALEPLGLSGKLLAVLMVLRSEGSHTQHEIGSLGCIDRSSAVVFIDALEERGFVRRSGKPGDRRAHVVVITDKGARALPKARLLAAKVQGDYLSCFDGGERKTLMALLRRLVQAHPKGSVCA